MILLTACAAVPNQQAGKRYLFPPPPDKQRLEWVGAYASQYDFQQTQWDDFRRKLAGKEPAQTFVKPWGIVSDGEGKVYISDTAASAVLAYNFETRKIEAIGAGTLKTPMGVALDSNGNVYVADSLADRIYVFDKAGKASGAIGDDSSLNWPVGMAVDDSLGRLYVVNGRNHNIAVFDLSGKYLFSMGRRGDGEGEFNFPTDVDIDSKGNLVVADSMNARVQILDPDGRFIRKFGQRGDRACDMQMIKGVAIDPHSDNIYVSDGQGDKVMVFSSHGEPLMSLGRSHSADITATGAGGFLIPQGIDVDTNGKVFVVDSLNRRFQAFRIVDEEWLRGRVEKIQKAERRL